MPGEEMDALGLLNLMITEKKPAMVPDWADLLMLYAKRLHELAPKLSDEEMQPLIAIGAAVYRRGYAEMEPDITAGAVLELARRGQPLI
jgi:hypothetical protein